MTLASQCCGRHSMPPLAEQFLLNYLKYCFGGDGSWPVVAPDAQLMAERGLYEGLLETWPLGLSKQPTDKVLDWLAPFQTPFTRGWTGVIRGKTVMKKGEEVETIDVMRDRLLGGGGWESVPDESGGDGYAFSRNLPNTYNRLHIAPRPYGWGVVVWEEHTTPRN